MEITFSLIVSDVFEPVVDWLYVDGFKPKKKKIYCCLFQDISDLLADTELNLSEKAFVSVLIVPVTCPITALAATIR